MFSPICACTHLWTSSHSKVQKALSVHLLFVFVAVSTFGVVSFLACKSAFSIMLMGFECPNSIDDENKYVFSVVQEDNILSLVLPV